MLHPEEQIIDTGPQRHEERGALVSAHARPNPRYRHLSNHPGVIVRLRTDLVARYRAVDREVVPAPSAVVDTPAHLDRLTESIAADGIRVPLRMGFNTRYAYLDGNHRIAVALRLGLPEVPVELVEEPWDAPRGHGQPMRREDLEVILAAFERADPTSLAARNADRER